MNSYQKDNYTLNTENCSLRYRVKVLTAQVERLRKTNQKLKSVIAWPAAGEIPARLADLGREICEHTSGAPSCVYFLFHGDELLYVGQSTCLPARIGDHIKDGKHFDRVLYTPATIYELDALETDLIQKLRPPLNGNDGPLRATKRAQMEAQHA